jgi:hypothetical protein
MPKWRVFEGQISGWKARAAHLSAAPQKPAADFLPPLWKAQATRRFRLQKNP